MSNPPPNPALAGKMPSKRSVRGIIKRLLRSLIFLYLLVCLVMYLLQTKLIFPGASLQNTPDATVRPAAGEELVPLQTPDGTPLAGLFGKASPRTKPAPALPESAPPTTPRPVVLYFYGNGECMNFSAPQSALFRDLGYHVMLIDYAGFGMSGGKPSEQGCYDAAEAAYKYLLARPDVDPRRLIVAGWSLGGAVAIDLVHRHRGDGTIAGLMTFCTFSSMVDFAQSQYPFLPVSLLLKHRFLSTDKLRDLTLPYFVGHGRRDALIPFDNYNRVVAAYAGSPDHLTRFVSDAADHNDFFDVAGEPLNKAIAAFLECTLK